MMEKNNSVTEKKDVMKMLRTRAKGKRAGIVILAVVLILVLLFVIISQSVKKSMSSSMQAIAAQQQTEEVTRRSLTKSVGATGTIVSVQSKDLSVTLTGIEVEAVKVSVGDTVQEGEELLVFDTEDIEESLSDAQDALDRAKQKNSISLSDAQRNVADAQRTESYQVDNAQSSVDSAYDDYQRAVSEYYEASGKLSDARSAENLANSNYAAAQEAVSAAETLQSETQAVLTEKETAYNSAKAALESDATNETLKAAFTSAETAYNEAAAAYEAAVASYNTALSALTEAQNTYNTAVTQREAQEDTVSSLLVQAQTKESSYESSVKSYDNTVASQASSVASAKSSQSTTALNATTDSEEKQVEQYQEQLEEGILKAPIAGIVTAVNYEEGDTYTQGTIITIQDCSSYEVEAYIGEYDISDIETGQKVLIKTDATGDEELEGTVIFVSPTASSTAAGTASGDVNYKVRISVDTANERLRLDMSASLSIIIEQHDDVLTVPYNAVQTDEDGNSFIQTVSEDGTQTKDVSVEVVMESNYYTEIKSEELSEGQKVRVVESTDDDTSMGMFSMGGGGF